MIEKRSAGGRHVNQMLDYLRKNPHVQVVLVESTDRFSRNMRDYLDLEGSLEKLAIETHPIDEGKIRRKAATA